MTTARVKALTWTQADEAVLQKLLSRKEAVHSLDKEALMEWTQGHTGETQTDTEFLIEHADAYVDCLAPFCEKEHTIHHQCGM